MPKSNSKGLEEQLADLLKKAKTDGLKAAGEYVVKTLHDRTREGSGVKGPGANKSALKPLSANYIKQRKRMDLHPDTSPSTSNLTKTGEMLDALYYKIVGGRLSVSVRGAKNLLKAMYTSVDRPWAWLSKGEATELRKVISRFMPNPKK